MGHATLRVARMKYKQLIVLIPSHGLEDLPTDLAEKPAASLINGFACLWHPALIASGEVIPQWQRADSPQGDLASRLTLIPIPSQDVLPVGWVEQARSVGGVVISGEHDREKILTQALAPLGPLPELDPELVADFIAFGTTYLLLELLTRRMRNFNHIDEGYLHREMVAAATAAVNADPAAARKHLTTCYEMLLESRERFYPVECFLLDLCLITPETANESFERLLQSPAPFNVHAPAQVWQTIVESDPRWSDRVQAALERKTLELVGGDDEEVGSALMSLDSTIWHLQTGRAIYQKLFGRMPVTWGRKRFGIGPHLPQILGRFGYQGAMHLVLDDGIYPDQEQSQVRWDGNDGGFINAISRIPLPADGASGIFRFAERMSESMDMDHVAAVMFARWPDMRTPFLDDLRRAQAYAPVLGKFVCFEEYFSRASGPARRLSHQPDEYLSPSLVHAVAAREADPVGRHIRYWERQRAFDQADWTRQVARVLMSEFGPDESASQLQAAVEAAHPEAPQEIQAAADQAITKEFSRSVPRLQSIVTGGGEAGPGVLIFNPLSFPRKTLIEWPSGSVPPQDRNVLGVQVDSDRTLALVNLPPCGFLWLAGGPARANTPPGKIPLAEELLLRNDLFEVRFSEATGGIAGIQTYRRSPNRLSQQVALRFPHEKLVSVGEGEERESIKTFYTSMQMRESRILSEGPLVGEIETLGDLVDENAGEVVATYRQRSRVVRGRPVVEVELEVCPARMLEGDPWSNYIGCRFAWRHIDVALTASMQQGAHAARKQRIEAPHFLEIADDDFRTTILTPGLSFHRKTGERMLDTLLMTEGETTRQYRFAIAIDTKYPMQECLDEYSPPIVVPTQTRPPEGSRVGWFFGLSAANVQLTRILPSSTPNSVIVRLLETEGRGRVLGLQCFRTPTSARQVNFRGETVMTLRIDDAVNVEISPYEICDIELTF
ncbi:hypothetical protein SH661x_001972 [Planctomicrobium sp. SH661]|uniref:glycoside hydrolase family 38 N-terminal domain-containing protein n=1 Tax=Planctomicrobium sp. SH661 TaxID=3448124 RepID=UPI003F5C2F9D